MKLSNNSFNELRMDIIDMLLGVPEGKRIHIKKELLDDLIFFKGKNKDGDVIKVPVWTGAFLRRIDLREISFKNVLFQNSKYINNIDRIEKIMDREPLSRFIEKIEYDFDTSLYVVPFVYSKSYIDFSYTNANIDFREMCSNKIVGCNFEGLDLKNADFKNVQSLYKCNFSNTNISTNIDFNNKICQECNFSNNDFSSITIDADIFNIENCSSFIKDCNFNNTGLHVKYEGPVLPKEYHDAFRKMCRYDKLLKMGFITSNEYYELIEPYEPIFRKYVYKSLYKELFGANIRRGYFEGCYVNDKKINSLEERQARALNKLEKYEKMKKEIFTDVINDINDQIEGFSK